MIMFNNSLGMNINNTLNRNGNEIGKLFQKLSTAKRINSFADDASGGVIATRLESQFRGIATEIRTTQGNINRLQTEESALGSITGDLQRIRELQVASQGQDESEVVASQDEINQLVDNIQTTVDNTQFAGGERLIEPGEELSNMLENGVDATGSLDATDAVIDEVVSDRGEIGSQINGMESRVRSQEVAFENTLAAQSRIADLDLAKAVTEMANKNILLQVSTSTLKNFMTVSQQNVMTLLGG